MSNHLAYVHQYVMNFAVVSISRCLEVAIFFVLILIDSSCWYVQMLLLLGSQNAVQIECKVSCVLHIVDLCLETQFERVRSFVFFSSNNVVHDFLIPLKFLLSDEIVTADLPGINLYLDFFFLLIEKRKLLDNGCLSYLVLVEVIKHNFQLIVDLCLCGKAYVKAVYLVTESLDRSSCCASFERVLH